MRRSLDQYKNAVPQAVADGSRAQMIYFVEDAQMDILELYRALEQSQKALAMMISPEAIMGSTVSAAFWEATAAEAAARRALEAR